MSGKTKPVLIIVAGPNGAGKSTYSSLRFQGLPIIDPDRTAQEQNLSSSAAWTKGKDDAQQFLAAKRSFVVETTLAGSDPSQPSTYLRMMQQARDQGYRVRLVYIALGSANVHLSRVSDRVAEGLHDIPESDVRRKYAWSIGRLAAAFDLADHVMIIDNASATEPFRLVAVAESGKIIYRSANVPRWASDALGARIEPPIDQPR